MSHRSKKAVSLIASSALLLGAFASFFASPAQALTTGTFIRGSMSTVYWYNTDGRRYVVPNERTFNSWTPLTQNVEYVTDSQLASIMIGGNLTYRPGVRMIKIQTDNRVYAVSRYGVLRWVTSEAIARALYGDNWNQMIDDVPDVYFTNYTIGEPIYSASDFNPSTESYDAQSPTATVGTRTTSSNSNSNTNTNTNVDTRTNALSLNANYSTLRSYATDRSLTLTAQGLWLNASTNDILIKIYNETTGRLEKECLATSTCSVTVMLPTVANTTTYRYRATVMSALTGGFFANPAYTSVTIEGASTANTNNDTTTNAGTFLSNTYVVLENTTVNGAGDVQYTARLKNRQSSLTGTTITIIDSATGQVVKSCSTSETCTATFPATTTVVSRTIYAKASDNAGHTLSSSSISFTTGSSANTNTNTNTNTNNDSNTNTNNTNTNTVTPAATSASISLVGSANDVCTYGVRVEGLVNVVGGLGTVKYFWEYEDGSTSSIYTSQQASNGVIKINETWSNSTNGSYTRRLHIANPNTISSNKLTIQPDCSNINGSNSNNTNTSASFTVVSQQSVSPVQVVRGQSVTFSSATSYDDAEGAVSVRVYRGDGVLLKTCAAISNGESCNVTTEVPQNWNSSTFTMYTITSDAAGHSVQGAMQSVGLVIT